MTFRDKSHSAGAAAELARLFAEHGPVFDWDPENDQAIECDCGEWFGVVTQTHAEHLAQVAEPVVAQRERAAAAAAVGETDNHGQVFVRHFLQGPRPKIVVLCGSTRFYDEFRRQNLRLTLQGAIVLSIGCDTRSDRDLVDAGEMGAAVDKTALDELHKRKIDLADQVLVINVDRYIGESTRSEIAYARSLGKPVTFLEDDPAAMPACPGGTCSRPLIFSLDDNGQATGYFCTDCTAWWSFDDIAGDLNLSSEAV
jgi:hypothetical protein